MRREDVIGVGWAIVEEVRRQDLPFLAASLAFYAFVSLLPLLLLVLVAATLVAGDAIADHLIALTRLYLSPTGQDLLADAITEAAGWVGSSILGLVVLVWSAFRIFLGIDIAFAQLYGTTTDDSITGGLRDAIVGLFAIATALFAAAASSAVVALFPDVPYLDALTPLLLVAGLVLVFFPLYYVFPDVEMSVREALPGAVVAAVGWAILESLFQFYVSITTLADVFGVIGGALLFLLWLYFGALVLLLGVVVNVVLADRAGDEPTVGTAATNGP
jgi:membrane protein